MTDVHVRELNAREEATEGPPSSLLLVTLAGNERLLYSFSGVLLGSSLCTKTFWLKDLHLRHPFHFYMCMGFQLAFSHASGHAFHFMLSLLS